ncbi:glutathione-disulfide reductase [Magnetospirillum fulvum]|uniref:Glutathione reductase n=1 Tax=Magnetospirillum fulvum MGU-K5 TaxID=1316936 RepID=S9TNT6_MAGFU|nr:glutathione-disulfide reductase [Magnetospirillum fulvum]EPY00260.1 glutathione reductase [Magnetospirillum fulvum MGU-K5]
MTAYDFDLITLGAGSGGVRASRLAAEAGRRVAVIEGSRVGGTCVMRGCVPKKLLVIGAAFAAELADAEAFGWQVEGAEFDWARLVAAKNAELNRLETIYARVLREAGVTLIEGRGTLVDSHTIQVGHRRLTAATILIATGGKPHLPDVPGIEHAITSNEALDLMQLPRRAVIVGGGYIAVEFAGIFNALGVEVTQLLRGDAILRGFDPDLRSAQTEEMRALGIDIRPHTVVRAIERDRNGSRVLTADPTGIPGETIETDLILYATGRVPNSAGLGLEAAGVELDERGAIIVDAFSRSSVRHIWAVGDVTNRLNLTPAALAEAGAFVRTAFQGCPTAIDHQLVPTAVFGTPPLATVGLGEDEARRLYGSVDVYLSRFRPLRQGLTGREGRALVKLVVERDDDHVLGVHVIGPDAPEIIQGFAVALRCRATKAQFDATLGVHPTAAEELVTLRQRRPEPAPRPMPPAPDTTAAQDPIAAVEPPPPPAPESDAAPRPDPDTEPERTAPDPS